MRETKKQILSRKNAEIACLQDRIKGIKSELTPLTNIVGEVIELCTLAIHQAETFFKQDN